MIPHIEQCTIEESQSIIYANLFAPEKIPLNIMNDSFVYTNPVQWIRGYKNLNFTDMFRIGVFNLDEQCVPEVPQPIETEEIREFVRDNAIDKSTVLISPYSNTLSELPNEIWIAIVQGLNKKGYRVLTNSSGDNEQAIEGTDAIFFPLNWTIQILNYMGGFIGVRSGFCDIASASTCKKMIFYDKRNYFFAGTAFDYFSLNKMGLCKDAYEILYDRTNEIRCIKEVLSYL